MDNLVIINIAKHADQETALSILHAGGPKLWKDAQAFNMIQNLDLVSSKDLCFETRFIITDPYNEPAILERINEAFYENYHFVGKKSYANAAKGWGKEYHLQTRYKYDFVEGMEFLKDLEKDEKLVFTMEVGITIGREDMAKIQSCKLPTIKLYPDMKPYLVTNIDEHGCCHLPKW